MKLFNKINESKLLYGGLIVTFIILYGATAFVSWYHSITFFNIANAVWLSVLLSFVAEIGQASVLFSILLTENKNKFLPWAIMIILTTLQVIGNVVSSYQWIIEHNSAGVDSFQKSILFWIETGDPQMFKVIIAWISGSLLPIIALSMTALVAQNMKLRKMEIPIVDNIKTEENTDPVIDAKDLIGEISKIRPTDDDLKTLEDIITSKEKLRPVEESPIIPNETITKETVPALSDEEIHEMNLNEHERKNYLPEEDDENYDFLNIEDDKPEVNESKIESPKIEVISNNGLVQGISVKNNELTGTELFKKEMNEIYNEIGEEIEKEENDKNLINDPIPVISEPTTTPIVEPKKVQQIIKKK